MVLECIEVQRPAEGQPQAPVSASIIVLHGLGADGHDFEPVAQQLQLGSIGAVRFILPHAPPRPVTLERRHGHARLVRHHRQRADAARG